jgi:hypothetical protein
MAEKSNFFSGLHFHIQQAGIGKARCQIFKKQIQNHGGIYEESFNVDTATHIIVDENMNWERLSRLMKFDAPPKGVNILKSVWLSKCIKEKQLIEDLEPYQLDLPKPTKRMRESCILGNVENDDDDDGASVNKKPLLAVDDAAESKIYDSSTPEPSIISTENKNVTSEEEKPKFPKVGVMYRFHKKKKEVTDEDAGSDYDSDYQPSGGEVSEDEDAPSTSKLSPGPANDMAQVDVPLTERQKNLPVNYSMYH